MHKRPRTRPTPELPEDPGLKAYRFTTTQLSGVAPTSMLVSLSNIRPTFFLPMYLVEACHVHIYMYCMYVVVDLIYSKLSFIDMQNEMNRALGHLCAHIG